MENEKGKIYTGTSGLVLPLPNIRSFPPEFHDKSRLEIYASLFNSIEINSSFYKVPMAKTVAKWAASVPDGFRFTFKLWRDITHNKPFTFNHADVPRFMQAIAPAGDKSGSLLIQLPPGIGIENMRPLQNLLAEITEADAERQWQIAVEFRNRSWYVQDVYNMVNGFNASVVLHDMPASAITQLEQDADHVYLRFHGPGGGYRGSYSDDLLYEYGQYITEWAAEGKTVYVYFNNTMGDAVKNLATLNNFLKMEG